jgi:hypothetical protein
MLKVTFGTVACQRLWFGNSVPVIPRVERLFVQLESVGFLRQRRDRREGRL